MQTATMLVSSYYQSDKKENHVTQALAQSLPRYGGWFKAARNHAKIIAADMGEGRAYVVESSANMRSCHCVEQFTITNDRALFLWHRTWMEEMLA